MVIIWLPLVSQSHLFPRAAGGLVTDTSTFNQPASEPVLTEILPRRDRGRGEPPGERLGAGRVLVGFGWKGLTPAGL